MLEQPIRSIHNLTAIFQIDELFIQGLVSKFNRYVPLQLSLFQYNASEAK